MRHSHLKAVAVANEAVFRGAIVVPENLLIEVAEKMEWFNRNVRALQAAFQKAPEVLQPVRVHLPVYVAFGMVNRLVKIVAVKTNVGHERIGVDRALCFDVSANTRLQVLFSTRGNYVRMNLSATLQDSHNGCFAFHATVDNLLSALVSVHEAGSATDEGLVHFYLFAISSESNEILVVQGKANAVHHEPSGLLSDAQGTGHFVGTDSVLRVNNHPNGNHPLVHAERGILKDSPDLNRELLLASFAEPDAAGRDERVLRRAATWARNFAIRPAQGHRIVKRLLRVREKTDCFLQRLGKLECVCHV